jgi:hypothetical protein
LLKKPFWADPRKCLVFYSFIYSTYWTSEIADQFWISETVQILSMSSIPVVELLQISCNARHDVNRWRLCQSWYRVRFNCQGALLVASFRREAILVTLEPGSVNRCRHGRSAIRSRDAPGATKLRRRAWLHRCPRVARTRMEPNSAKPPLQSSAPGSDGPSVVPLNRNRRLWIGMVRRDVHPFHDTVAWPPAIPAARSAFACSVVNLARARSGFSQPYPPIRVGSPIGT